LETLKKKLTLPLIKYKFPANGNNPFDHENSQKYFAFADEFSLSSDKLDDFNLQIFEEFIPMGYKTILICQRLGLFSNGKLLTDWRQTFGAETDFYMLSDKKVSFFVESWGQNAEIYIIPPPDFKDLSYHSMKWNNLDKAYEKAQIFTLQNQVKILVVKVIDSISWH
jgi:hypothetical protein